MAVKNPWGPDKKLGFCHRLGRDHSVNDRWGSGPDAYCRHCKTKWDELEKKK